jgi:hypothetical protein
VKENETVHVKIPAPMVTVSGLAMSNGKPVIGGEVRFVRFLVPLTTPFVQVATDDQGRYTAVLNRLGEYDVRLSIASPRRAVWSERRTLTAGLNNLDLSGERSGGTTSWFPHKSQ